MRIILAVILLTICTFTAGCWDRVEIQDRGMVKALGIDLAQPPVPPGETFTQAHGEKKYTVSFQLIKFSPGEGEKSSSAGPGTYVVADTGQSIFELLRDSLGQTSKNLNFEHLDCIVISEAAVKDTGLRPLIDFFIRDPEFRWRLPLFITSGLARPIIEYQPPSGEPGGKYIAGIVQNQIRDAHLAVSRTDLGYTTIALDNDADAALPRIELNDGDLKIGGLAVFQGDKFIGYMDEYSLQGIRVMRNLQKSAAITAQSPFQPGGLVVLDMINVESEVRPLMDNTGLYFTDQVEVDGDLEEFMDPANQNFDPKMVPELEKTFALEIKNNILYGLHTAQKLKVDPGGYLMFKIKAYRPDIWKQIEPNWRDALASARFIITVKVHIRDLGEHY